MGRMQGADADELDRLGRHMQAAAGRLDALRGEVTAAFNRTSWEGGDADYFRGQWHYRLSGLLHAAAGATREASAALARNAEQQRIASGTEGGSVGTGLVPGVGPSGAVGGIDVGALAATLFGAGGQLMMIPDLLKLAGHDPGVGALLGKPWMSTLLEEHTLLHIPDSATGLAAGLRRVDKAGPLALIGLGFDGVGFVKGLASDPSGADTYQAGIDTAFDVAEIATVECPPVSLAIGAVHLGYDVAEAIHPGVGKAVAEGTAHAAAAVVDTAVNAVVTDAPVVQGVAGAGGDVESGGLNAGRDFFHW